MTPAAELWQGDGLAFGGLLFHHAPDSTAFFITARVVERDFVVADDLVVEVGHIEGAVGAELEIDGTKPGVVAGDEVGLLVGLGCGAGEGDVVVVDAGGDAVAKEDVIVPFRAPDAAVEVNDAADAGAAMRVLAHDGREAEAVMRFAKTGIAGAADELIHGRAVAVGAVEVAVAIPGEAEGVDLAAGVFFDA